MYRSLTLMMVVLAGAPAQALAQTWPATVVASAPQMRNPSRTAAFSLRRDTPQPGSSAGRFTGSGQRALMITATPPSEDVPQVEVRAKDAWTNDEGFRARSTRLSFKRSF